MGHQCTEVSKQNLHTEICTFLYIVELIDNMICITNAQGVLSNQGTKAAEVLYNPDFWLERRIAAVLTGSVLYRWAVVAVFSLCKLVSCGLVVDLIFCYVLN